MRKAEIISMYRLAVLVMILTRLLFEVTQGFCQAGYRQSEDSQATMSHDNEGVLYQWTAGDSIVEEHTYDPNQEVRVIVRLQATPLAWFIADRGKQSSPHFESARSAIREQQGRFRSGLAEIEQRMTADPAHPYQTDRAEIHDEYQTVLNAVVLTTRQWMLEEIRKMPEVVSVAEDRKIWATLDTSVIVIGADVIWSEYEVTGEGIVVGILDTGIDYMHPDLGGGIGSGFKVLGGHDFVNEDNDPLDDNGHGTHVAGIVAANGVLKGVAPDASLMAYKVLAAEGWGLGSWILAGIEQAVMDNVDVMNLSLGGPGDADDPLSEAIDNASIAGVVCVVAAGNAGSKYYTVDSPGCARRAFTVGASDKNDSIAKFSSRGPAKVTYTIKPDILAPGVKIQSTMLNGEYKSLNGTSMATPHVAGAVALFIDKYPGYSPGQIKSIFMQTAVDLGYDIWTQGTGRIDLVNAFELPDLVAVPAMLGFGLADTEVDVWTKTDTLFITNILPTGSIVTLTTDEGFPDGVDVVISPSTFTLQPYETLPVAVTISVDNELVPFPQTQTSAYHATILVTGEGYQTTIPMAFVKMPLLRLVFDESPYMISAYCGWDYKILSNLTDQIIDLLVPVGNYLIKINYYDQKTVIIDQNVNVSQFTVRNYSKLDAKNKVSFISCDENGASITPYHGAALFLLNSNGAIWEVSTSGTYFPSEFFFNDFTDLNFYYKGCKSSSGGSKIYLVAGHLNECLGDTSFTYQADELKYVQLTFESISENTNLFPRTVLNDSAHIHSAWHPGAPPLEYPFIQELYFSPFFQYENYGLSFCIDLYNYPDPPDVPQFSDLLYRTPKFTLQGDDLFVFTDYYIRPWYKELTGFHHNSGALSMVSGPPVWNGVVGKVPEYVSITNINNLFLLQNKSYLNTPSINHRLYHNGALIDSGNLLESNPILYTKLEVEPGPCILEVEYDLYEIQGQQGFAMARMGFDRSNPGHVPELRSFNVTFNNGVVTDFIAAGEEGIIQFAGVVYTPSQDTTPVILEYSHLGDPSWMPLDLDSEDSLHTALITDSMPEGYISLRIALQDNWGNSLEYTIEPAFLRGSGTLPVVSTSEAIVDIYENTALTGGYVSFHGGSAISALGVVWSSSPDPTLENNEGITIDGAGLGMFTSEMTGLLPQTVYHVRAYATNSTGTGYGDNVLTIEIPPCPVPFGLYTSSPTTTSVLLHWSEFNAAIQWDVIYGEPGFDLYTEGTLIQDIPSPPYLLNDLIPATYYEFYVRAHCEVETSEWSASYVFSTSCEAESVPFSETFDDSSTTDLPLCWSGSGTGYYIIKVGPWMANSEPNSVNLIHSAYNTVFLISPEFENDISQLNLSFSILRDPAFPASTINVGTVSDPNDINTFSPFHEFEVYSSQSTSWHHYIVYFNEYEGDDSCFAFRLGDDDVMTDQAVYIDDIQIGFSPPCPEPTEPFAEDITMTTASLYWTSWVEGATWTIEWGPQGFIPGMGNITEDVSEVPYMLTGLEQATKYDFYVKAQCGEDEYSNWSVPYSFITQCDLIPLPLSENFDSTPLPEIPTCWVSNGFGTWEVKTVGYESFSIPNSIRLQHYTDSYALLVAPRIDDEIADLRVRFKARCQAGSDPGNLTIGSIINPLDGLTFFPLEAFQVAHDDLIPWQGFTVFLPGFDLGENYLGFRLGNESVSTSGSVFLDDIIIEPIPDCPEPYDIVAVEITPYTAEIHWSHYGNSILWTVAWGEPGFDPESGGNVCENLSEPVFTVSGLSPGTYYDVYVQAFCDDDVSGWSEPLRIATTCVPVGIPCSEFFDNVQTPFLPLCWSSLDQESHKVQTVSFPRYSPPNSIHMRQTYQGYNMLITPKIGTDINSLSISFKLLLPYEPEGKLFVGTISDPQDGNTFQTVAEFEILNTGYIWQDYLVYMDTYTGSDEYIAIRFGEETNQVWARLYLDNIVIDNIPSCYPPQDLTVINITANGAELQWTPVSNETLWNVEYGPSDFQPGSGVLVTELISNSLILDSLIPDTEYEFYVQAVCDPDDTSPWAGPEAFTTLEGSGPDLPGDANCDGNVDVLDIITIVNYIMGASPDPFCFENADINQDVAVDVLDIIGTVNIIMGGN